MGKHKMWEHEIVVNIKPNEIAPTVKKYEKVGWLLVSMTSDNEHINHILVFVREKKEEI